MKVNVAVIDTEVYTHTVLKDIKINNLWNNDLKIKLWHGTAVCGEIYQECQDVEIDVYPVFRDMNTEVHSILSVLKDILESEKTYNVINMSLGIEDATFESSLRDICIALQKKGSIIVAAFNNDGTMTYPACLESVIGVDLSMQLESKKGYTYIEGGVVNILGPMIQRNVLYPPDERKMVIGTSFFCAHISGIICKYISNTNGNYTEHNVRNFLKQEASDIKVFKNYSVVKSPKINKYILFPFSKEMMTILNLQKYTEFETIGIYDFKLSKYYGQSIETLDKCIFRVQSINEIEWNSFDTLVLGHIDNYINLKLKDQIKFLIDKCLEHGKQIYAFDNDILKLYQGEQKKLSKLNNHLYYPSVNKKHFPHGHVGKLWKIPVPIVSIMGTRSQQGKFTTQIQIKHYLQEKGYRVGLITSEPSGALFNADYIFPYGYHKMVDVPQEEYSIYINDLAYKSFLLGRDILLFASQTGVLPRNYDNMNQCTVMQFSLLFGLSPDIVVLCVSPDDEIDLILRTISSIESFSQAIVQSIVVNPVLVNIDSSGKIIKTNLLKTDPKSYDKFIHEISKKTDKSVYKMNELNIKNVVNEILSSLEE